MSAVESVTTRRPLAPNGVATRPAWNAVDRLAYVSSLQLLDLPGEEDALCFLFEAVSDCWLPPGWEIIRDQFGQCYFASRLTGEATWSHPLAPQLRELAGVFRMCVHSEEEVRDLAVDTLLQTWQEEARLALEPWKQAVDSVGVQCYQHRTSRAVAYMDPAADVLPQLYIRSVALRKLRAASYRVDKTEEVKALVGPLQQHLVDVQMRQHQHQMQQLEQDQQDKLNQLQRLHTPRKDESLEKQQQQQQAQLRQQAQQQAQQQQQQQQQQEQQWAQQYWQQVQQVQQQQVQQLQQQLQQQMQQQAQQHHQQQVELQKHVQLLGQLKREQDEERDEMQQHRRQVWELLSQSQGSQEQQPVQQQTFRSPQARQQTWKRSQVVPEMQQDEFLPADAAGSEDGLRIVSPDGTEILVRKGPRRAGRTPGDGPAQPAAAPPGAVPSAGANSAVQDMHLQQLQWQRGWGLNNQEQAFLPGALGGSDASQLAGQAEIRLAHSADRAAVGAAPERSLDATAGGPDQAAGALGAAVFK